MEYKALVLSLDTGPIARLIEIICPTILAIVRAHTKVFGFNEAMQYLSLEILSAGTKKEPADRSRIKPSQSPLCTGSSMHLAML